MWENIKKERNFWIRLVWFVPIVIAICLFIKLFLPSKIVYNTGGHEYIRWFADRDVLILFLLIVMIVLVLLFLFKWIRYDFSIKKHIGQLNEISNDIDNSNYIHVQDMKLYITNKYVLEYRHIINVFEIDDILWVYPKKNISGIYRVNGINTRVYYTFEFLLKSGKIFPATSFLYYKGCELEKVDELISFIKLNNPNVAVGYTDENIKYFRDKGYKVY